MLITASHLYAYTQCPHRIYRDAHDDPSLQDPVNEFVQLLWEHGTQYEKEIIARHGASLQLLDLSVEPVATRAERTLQAMRDRTPYIYHGRLQIDDLLGEPDLLELQESGDYIPIDIKSGMGLQGADEESDEPGKPKKHYALQLALYLDALRRLGFSSGSVGKIWDSSGAIVEYDLSQPQGKRNLETWWELYQESLLAVRRLLEGTTVSEPALASVCGMCVWKTDCKRQCKATNDLSLVPELGRSRKEGIRAVAPDLIQLAQLIVANHVDTKGKTGIKGIGQLSLEKYQRRAQLILSGSSDPLILEPFTFPNRPIELYFDIEADPTRDLVYLHGVVERRDGDDTTRRFHDFTAAGISLEDEKNAWQGFWNYIRSLPADQWVLYYYSKYELTQYKNLAKRYPEVATEDEVLWLFEPERAVDLYFDIVKKCTEWPTYNYSVKSIAQHLGFSWRDTHPSGAASIQWFNEWVKDREPQKLQRILDYNEDDCIAMIVLKDKLAAMQQ